MEMDPHSNPELGLRLALTRPACVGLRGTGRDEPPPKMVVVRMRSVYRETGPEREAPTPGIQASASPTAPISPSRAFPAGRVLAGPRVPGQQLHPEPERNPQPGFLRLDELSQ